MGKEAKIVFALSAFSKIERVLSGPPLRNDPAKQILVYLLVILFGENKDIFGRCFCQTTYAL
ncbi:MAG: hypothetical protein A2007_00120 [Verrucomicrobia bacterium GWC2_42_7]|nr:MAG: hypothetical protein A2007_00120 [Verrucomicrobia bacterium GWC2_42_7]